MKKIVFVSVFLLVSSAFNLFSQAVDQQFLQIVSLESDDGKIAEFTTVGQGNSNGAAETNALHSLFYTLLYTGVDEVNNGVGLVIADNKTYTNSFFNSQARYKVYCVKIKRLDSEKVGDIYQVRMLVTLRLQQLLRDVARATAGVPVEPIKPSIMVVPFKRQQEDYRAIIENDFDISAAIAAVQTGFIDRKYRMVDFKRWTEISMESDFSSDREFLMASGADVYVTVRVNKEIGDKSRVSLELEARETSTGNVWANVTGSSTYSESPVDVLCSKAVRTIGTDFYRQIDDKYREPVNARLEINVHNESDISMFDICYNGERIVDVVKEWVMKNAYRGDFSDRGEASTSLLFDYIAVPRADAEGKKVTVSSFANELRKYLIAQGVELDKAGMVIKGNSIYVTIGSPVGNNVVSPAKLAYLFISENNDLEGVEKYLAGFAESNNIIFTDEPHKADYFVELKSTLELDDVVTSGIYNQNPCYVQLTLKFYDNKTQKLRLNYTTNEFKVMVPAGKSYKETVLICINEAMKRVRKTLPEKLMLLN